MPRNLTQTRTFYRLSELKDVHPEAFAKVHERWKRAQQADPSPWSDEIVASLKETVAACGFELRDWSIGPWSPSHIDVRDMAEEDEDAPKDLAWFSANVLEPNGYTKGDDGVYTFPGHCPFTGYYFDEDCLESVYNAMRSGESMERALEGLAGKASEAMEADCEQMEEAESMLINWGDDWYDEDGEEADAKTAKALDAAEKADKAKAQPCPGCWRPEGEDCICDDPEEGKAP